jgi:prefoldin subunit 5
MANAVLENIEDAIEILTLRIEKLKKSFDKLD